MGDILGVGRGWIREKEGGNLNCEQAQGFWRLNLILGWPESASVRAGPADGYMGSGTWMRYLYTQDFEQIWSKKRRKRERTRTRGHHCTCPGEML